MQTGWILGFLFYYSSFASSGLLWPKVSLTWLRVYCFCSLVLSRENRAEAVEVCLFGA